MPTWKEWDAAAGGSTPWPMRTTPPPIKARKPKPSQLPEFLLQAAFIAELHALEAAGAPITCAGDMNASKRSYAQASRDKASGLTAGEPDVRIYLPEGQTILVEIKRKGGRVSEAQEARHARLRALGHPVVLAFLDDLTHARLAARALVEAWAGGAAWV